MMSVRLFIIIIAVVAMCGLGSGCSQQIWTLDKKRPWFIHKQYLDYSKQKSIITCDIEKITKSQEREGV